MCLTEFDEKTFVNGIKEEGREEGRKEGRKEGRMERDKEKIAELLHNGKTPQQIADFCSYPMDLIQKVLEEMLIGN